MDDQRLMFLHLPKTAGSTLRRIIERQYGIDAVYAIGEPTSDSIDRLLELPRQRLDSLRAVVGHVPFGLHELLPWPVAYVTLIREPVDRIVSHYHSIGQSRRSEAGFPDRQVARASTGAKSRGTGRLAGPAFDLV